jgi:LysM repeat protein
MTNSQPNRPAHDRQARNRGDVARGLATLAVTAFLLVGVPLVLAQAGWPLPHGLPSLAQIGHGLTHELQVAHIVKALVVVCWLAWATLAWAIVGELVALRTGRPPRQRRGIGPFQMFAARLVAGITLLVNVPLALGAVQPASALPQRTAPIASMYSAPTVTVSTTPSAPAAAPDATSAAVAASATPGTSIVVQPRDSLHKIAEDRLGDAMRWREVWDLNAGNTMSDGSVFTRPELIRPGWVLQLPASGPPSTVTVVAGDTLSAIAQTRLGDANRWPEIVSANHGRSVAPGQALTNPDHIEPGWRLALPTTGPVTGQATAPTPAPAAPNSELDTVAPAVSAVEETAPRLPSLPAPSPAPSPRSTFLSVSAERQVGRGDLPDSSTDGASSARVAPAEGPRRANQSVGVFGLAGATLLATGALSLIAARRRRRLRSMGPDHELPDPDPALQPIANKLNEAADAPGIERVRQALRVLAVDSAVDLSGSGSVVFDSAGSEWAGSEWAGSEWAGNRTPAAPRPLVLLVDPLGNVEVVLDRVMRTPPVPFSIVDRADTLRLDAAVDLTDHPAAARVFDPCPGLVMIGRTNELSGSRSVYLDLEAVGALSVDPIAGTGASAAVVRAIVATLSVSPLSDSCVVLNSGVELGLFTDERRLVSVPSVDAVCRLLESGEADGLDDDAVDAVRETLRAWVGEDARPPIGRRADRSSEPLPLTVVAASDLSLVQLGSFDRAGFAVVTNADVATSWRLSVVTDDERPEWQLLPLGLRLTPIGVTEADVDALANLLADAARPPVLKAVAPPAPANLAGAIDNGFVEVDWSLLVRLLGSVDVVDRVGQPVAFERSKALELTAWLVEHRNTPLRSLARTALWLTNVTDATFHNVISDARRSMDRLVPLDDDADWITRHGGERLDLHAAVRSDVELVRARFDYARRSESVNAVSVLRPALAMIRDLPLVGTDYSWTESEAIASSLTHLATSVATVAARNALALGDYDGAFAATAIGLRVLPGHDDLVCLRMEAHALQGNLAGVRHEYASYEKSLSSDPWFDGEASPKVLSVRARLLAPSSPSVSAA